MKCENCAKDVKRDFNYCPYCGNRIRKSFFSMFKSLFDRGKIEQIKGPVSPFSEFPMMKGGITIKVTGPKGTKVRKIPLGAAETQKIPAKAKIQRSEPQKSGVKPPKELIEPESVLKKQGDRFILSFKLPDVKHMKDIDIMKFPHSLELRARVKDKMYFKLMKLPKEASIVNKSFDKGVLTVELS